MYRDRLKTHQPGGHGSGQPVFSGRANREMTWATKERGVCSHIIVITFTNATLTVQSPD